MLWGKIVRMLSPRRPVETVSHADVAVVKGFRKRYARFRKLIDANAALGELLGDLEEKLTGKSLFGAVYVRHTARQAVRLTRRMAESLESMRPGAHRGLNRTVDDIENGLDKLIGQAAECLGSCRRYTIPLTEVDLSMVDWVGGKCAGLGEMASMAGVPIPRGFAVTITAFHRFMEHGGLAEKVEKLLLQVNSEEREALAVILAEVRALVEQAPMPPDLEEALRETCNAVFGDEPLHLAVRSSARSEDGDKSFAGQFQTELNVPREDLPASWRRVVAGLFTPSATLYRLHQGIPLSESAMAVGCLEMINAGSSGVAYSHDPVNLLSDTMLINGVWGLGKYAVDGVVTPDLWVLTRGNPPMPLRRRAGMKDRRLTLGADGSMYEESVPEEQRKAFCLSEAEVAELARVVMHLEKHYGGHQDVEWAKDEDGALVLLQSRPLDVLSAGGPAPKPPLLEQYPLLLEGGDVAYPGVGHGPVVIPHSTEDLLNFPKGGILAARHSSAEYAVVLDRAQAVLTETGGISGHMATICREYRVPTLLNLPGILDTLQPGQVVTVDAFSGRVYDGVAEELLPLRLNLDSVRLHNTPVYKLLSEVSELILPLHLTDPQAASFAPSGCKSLHDVMRYAHEHSYYEMFSISDTASDAGGVALKLKAPLPIDLHIIDLDNGTTVEPGSVTVTPEQIVCTPLKALLNGMLHPDVVFRRPRPVNMGGFMSVMGRQLINPQDGDGRFGDKSYAIISDRWVNFSSRVGYHYSVLDAYCGNTMSKNYVSFSFQGGAAGEERRARRCRAIGLVLEDLGFNVDVRGDRVKSRFQKYPREQTMECLDQLGRLLQVTRQMDMLMTSEGAVRQFREDFKSGRYQ